MILGGSRMTDPSFSHKMMYTSVNALTYCVSYL